MDSSMAGVPNWSVSEVEVDTVFRALAVTQLDGTRAIGQGNRYGAIGKIVAEALSQEGYNDPEKSRHVLQYNLIKHGVRNYAEFKNIRKVYLDEGYRAFALQHKDNLHQLCAQRKTAYETRHRELSRDGRLMLAKRIVEILLPHVSYGTLLSVQMMDFVNAGLLDIAFSEYLRVVKMCIVARPLEVGGFAPEQRTRRGVIRRQRFEIDHANKILNTIGYGPASCLEDQQTLYHQDVARLAKYVSFQTLASLECYKYLGERFKFKCSQGFGRRLSLEHLEHVKVVGDVMDEMDAVDMVRMCKDFEDDYENYILRKQEMLEIEHRFGVHFTRYVDESRLYDASGLTVKKGCVVIFYAILKDSEQSCESPNTERVIRGLIRAGRLDTLTAKEWADRFNPEHIEANPNHERAVVRYLRFGF